MKFAAALLFCMALMMDICGDDKGGQGQWVVRRQPSNHNCAAMLATAMGSAAGMTEILGTYSSKSQGLAALATFRTQEDPQIPTMKVCTER